jgi:type IV pilus assembly protein PilV
MKNILTLKKQIQNSGFSLLEVLITILVVSFGMLGMAALIISGVRSNNIAHYRSVASKQTEDIADRMRANLAGVTAGNYNSLAGSTPTSDDCLTGTCNPTQMAIYDHAQWNRANSILLPEGRGTVQGSLTAGYTVTLMWTEKDMNGESDLSCPAGVSVNTRCFVSRFAP